MCYHKGNMELWKKEDVVNKLLEKAEIGELMR